MKKSLILISFLFVKLSLAQSFERRLEVVTRTENHKPKVEKVLLTDLLSEERFEGRHFKIVQGKNDEAIRFDDSKELTFRAATVYYHLTRARNYFVEQLNSDYVASMEQLVIRIEHTNQFSELGHFAHDNLDPQFNNALTIPAGEGLSSKGVKPWGMEIWFRPKKRVHLRDLKTNELANIEFHGLMSKFRNQIHMQSLQRFIAQLVVAVTTSGDVLSSDALIRTAGSSVIMEAGYQFYEPISKFFSRKWYWMDSALVPEIIYHEYAHAALSDHLVLSHSSATIEGMADFFAGQIANSPKLADKIKKYNTFNGKDATRKTEYMIQFESNTYANTDFVFGMLWEVKNILGQHKGEAFMFELRKKITTNSSVRVNLIEGILTTCDEICETPFLDKLQLLKALNSRGL